MLSKVAFWMLAGARQARRIKETYLKAGKTI